MNNNLLLASPGLIIPTLGCGGTVSMVTVPVNIPAYSCT